MDDDEIKGLFVRLLYKKPLLFICDASVTLEKKEKEEFVCGS